MASITLGEKGVARKTLPRDVPRARGGVKNSSTSFEGSAPTLKFERAIRRDLGQLSSLIANYFLGADIDNLKQTLSTASPSELNKKIW